MSYNLYQTMSYYDSNEHYLRRPSSNSYNSEDTYYYDQLFEIMGIEEIRGDWLLDASNQSNLYSSLFASARFSHIVVGNSSEKKRAEIVSWLSNDGDIDGMSGVLSYAAELESKSSYDYVSALTIEGRAKNSIRAVVSVDLSNDDESFGDGSSFWLNNFDCIISDLTFESVESANKLIERLTKKLKLGGYFIITGVTRFDSIEFKDVRDAFLNNNFDISYENECELQQSDTESVGSNASNLHSKFTIAAQLFE